MNVKQLKEKLNKYPDDCKVVIDGYEEGVDDLKHIRKMRIVLNTQNKGSWWVGKHSIIMTLKEEEDYYYKKHKKCDAILLN